MNTEQNNNTTPETTPSEPPTETTAQETTPNNPYNIPEHADDGTEPNKTSQEPNTQEPETPYQLQFDGYEPNEQLATLLTQKAHAAGLPPDLASKFLSQVGQELDAQETQAFNQADAQLKATWGRDYEANIQQTASFASRIAKEAGLTPEEIDAMQNPLGFKILHALSKKMGETPLAGASNHPSISPAEEMHAIMNDPNHKYYKAIVNPADPLYKEAHARYNKLVGITQ